MTADDFWMAVSKTDGCWLWTRSRSKFGYGQLRFRGVTALAHRVSYFLANGEIPEGKSVLHRCDNPPCVRPDHLFVGSQLDNIADMISKGRNSAARGDESGARTRPESRPRGEGHFNASITEETVVEIRRLYESGMSSYQLAEQFGMKADAVWQLATGRTWAHVPGACTRAGRRSGSLHHRSKLDETKVRAIRELASKGFKQRDLAAMFDVPQNAIWCVIHRKTWRHVD